ncbi:MAG: M67 family metallopeptidase [Candidatus Calescibacterium sp.]|nr:M67 family metallopeptidase [Candidatus Calescibacterium sp.]MCX7734106.1 M67 family metallopeptidase [bacterium]MDW8087848.1 M67 family metallopeptidase [Candidatus Calescibacterium sp.]
MGYKVILPQHIIEFIAQDGKERYPNEACGIILGQFGQNVFISKEAQKAKNLSDNPIRFILDPMDFLRIQDYADKNNLEIIGVYHTHPDHPPIASQYDLQSAVDGLVYVIMSIWDGKMGDIKSFVLSQDGNFIEIKTEITK